MTSSNLAPFTLCRVLCVILAALTLAFTLSPALVQPAEAVAVADDLTLALTLLFTSWAGITFASNAGAQTAVSNLLSSKPAVASSVAGLITKGLVTEGSKLLLTGDVRTAFRGMLTDIQDFFQVKSEAVSSAGGGMLADNIVLGVFYDVPLDGSEVYYPVGLFLDYDVRLLDTTSGKITSTYHNYYNFSSEEADLLVAPVYKTDGGSQTSFFVGIIVLALRMLVFLQRMILDIVIISLIRYALTLFQILFRSTSLNILLALKPKNYPGRKQPSPIQQTPPLLLRMALRIKFLSGRWGLRHPSSPMLRPQTRLIMTPASTLRR